MQCEVLESLVSRGSFVGVICPKNFDIQKILSDFARTLSGDAPFLFEEYPQGRGSARTFLDSLRKRREEGARYVFVRFSGEFDGDAVAVLASMRMAIVLSEEDVSENEIFSELEALAPFPPGFFWWVSRLPDKKKFPRLFKAISDGCVSGWTSAERFSWDGERAANLFLELLRAKILRENALTGTSRLFRKLFIPLVLLVAAIPFAIPSDVDSGKEMFRNAKAELALFSERPYFDYTFGGTEPLERIARYAVGRFAALVTTEKMVRDYVGETLSKNGFPENAWEKNRLHVPPAETTVRFSIPENLSNPAYDSIAPAWKFFMRIIGDSVAYVTELYNERPTAKMRKHEAWDVASRSGARILAPFSGKAWTFKDERGGTVIGIVGDKKVILFMHCDQLLYLDGQNVMQGDPVATVGTTGHTTGPHVHIVTGLVDKRGSRILGNVRYRIVSPLTWYYSGN